MSLITILAERNIDACQENWYAHLLIQKQLINSHFPWLNLQIAGKVLKGEGILKLAGEKYQVSLSYSPFYSHRFDRIYIRNKAIKYHDDIHVYHPDLALCLYHPKFDGLLFSVVPLFRMIPWISEWCIFYEQWKKYGVWLGKEIKH